MKGGVVVGWKFWSGAKTLPFGSLIADVIMCVAIVLLYVSVKAKQNLDQVVQLPRTCPNYIVADAWCNHRC